MKYLLTRIARELGYTATPEHPPTRADVFMHEPSYCLEIQLVPTQFAAAPRPGRTGEPASAG